MIPLASRDGLTEALVVAGDDDEALPPQLDDLYVLYQHARMTAVVAALEVGSGWSTLVLAVAVAENRASFAGSYTGRHPNPWRLHTIDADERWLKVAVDRLDRNLAAMVDTTVAEVQPTTWSGQSATRFSVWPPFVADLIYLDGPDPDQAMGEVRGSHLDRHGLPMSADLLEIEPHLWPGTVIIIDGRTANARFLAANLRRRWQTWHDPFGDRTWMRLDEPPLGPVSAGHLEARMRAADLMRRGGPGDPWGTPA